MPITSINFDEDGFSWPKGPAPGIAHPAYLRLAHRLRAMAERYTRAGGAIGGGLPPRAPIPVDVAVCSHVAKHAYEKTNDKSISFGAGAPADVVQETEGGWVRVRIGAEEGWAPKSYLRPVEVKEGFPEIAAMEAAGMLSSEHAAAVADLHRDLSAYV